MYLLGGSNPQVTVHAFDPSNSTIHERINKFSDDIFHASCAQSCCLHATTVVHTYTFVEPCYLSYVLHRKD